jgi:hypothetical protein
MGKGCQKPNVSISGTTGVTLFTGPGEGYDPLYLYYQYPKES